MSADMETPSSSACGHDVVWLHHGDQRLGLVPSVGGSVAAWQHLGTESVLDLWRPWSGREAHPNHMACYPLVPWSNRVSGGGFEHDGVFHPLKPNLKGERYPIHGNAWLQSWHLTRAAPDTAVMTLSSWGFDDGPYAYHAAQTLQLVPGGLDHMLTVRHLGSCPLPYGLGLHPWFPRTPNAGVQATVERVWLSGPDKLPIARTSDFPPGWHLTHGTAACGSLIDNGFDGWNGQATLKWPEHGLTMTMDARLSGDSALAQKDLCCILYRPSEGDTFCLEPVTHPIDAFHLPGRPGLFELEPNQQLSLHVRWRYKLG